jgi:two-component system, sensor histidine kinase and response regulator
MDLGADDYITKPFTRLELLNAVQTRMEKKAAQEYKRQVEVYQWQQAFEQEHEQCLLKSKLVAMFSHDFRNPLTLIMSSNSLLRDYADRLDEARRLDHFNRIESSVRQLIQMLDDMLIVAQMESGTLAFNPAPLNIGAFIQDIVEGFQAVHNESNPILYDNQLPDIVQADGGCCARSPRI